MAGPARRRPMEASMEEAEGKRAVYSPGRWGLVHRGAERGGARRKTEQSCSWAGQGLSFRISQFGAAAAVGLLLCLAGGVSGEAPARAYNRTIHGNLTRNDSVIRTAVIWPDLSTPWSLTFSSFLKDQVGNSFGLDFETVFVDHPGHPELEHLMMEDLAHFVFIPAEITACHEAQYGISPLVTKSNGQGFAQIGGMMFSKAASIIDHLDNFTQAIVAATLDEALTGYLLQAEEYFAVTGSQLMWDAKQIIFLPDKPAVLQAVLDGVADVGFSELKHIQAYLNDGTFKVLHELHTEDLGNHQDLLTSTGPAPGWSLSSTRYTEIEVQRAVMQALLDMPTSHPAAVAAGYTQFYPPLSHGKVRDFLEEQNMLQFVPEREEWECFTTTDRLYEMINCGSGFKLVEDLTFERCPELNLPCPAQARCICQPCYFQKEVEMFPLFSNGTQGESCKKMHVCGRTEQRQQISYLIKDNFRRDRLRVDYKLHDSRVQALTSTSSAGNLRLNATHGYGEMVGPGEYVINVSTDASGLHILEILVNLEQVELSPVFIGVSLRDCSSVGDHRVATESGDCICDGETMEVLRRCVRRSVFFSASLIPVVFLMSVVLAIFIRAKIRAADAFWLIDIKDLKFPDPPEILGQGTYGEVLKAWYLGTEVAVKRAMSGHFGSRSSANGSMSQDFRTSASNHGFSSPVNTLSVFGSHPGHGSATYAFGRPESPIRGTFGGTQSPAAAVRSQMEVVMHDGMGPTAAQLRRLAQLAGEDRTQSAGVGRVSSTESVSKSRHSHVQSGTVQKAASAGLSSKQQKRPSKMPTGPDEAPSTEQNGDDHPLAPENPGNAVLLSQSENGQNGASTENGNGIPRTEFRVSINGKQVNGTKHEGEITEDSDMNGVIRTESGRTMERSNSGSTLRHPKRTSVQEDYFVKSPRPRPTSPATRAEARSPRGRVEARSPRSRSPDRGSLSPILRGPVPVLRGDTKPQSELSATDANGHSNGHHRDATGSAGGTSPITKTTFHGMGGVDDVSANTKDITVPPPQTLREAMERANQEKPQVRAARVTASTTSKAQKGYFSRMLEKTSVGRTVAKAISTTFTGDSTMSWWNQRHMREDFIAEMRILSRLRHPCITTVMGAVINRKDAMLVMEFMRYGSLYDMLQNDLVEMDSDMMKHILLDVTSGMEFLHSNNPPIVHGDLKTGNILVDQRFRAKVADFGFSMEKRRGAGTPLWMAPELLAGGYSTLASDVYAFGITLYEVATRKLPYETDQSLYFVLQEIMDPRIDRRPQVSSDFPEKMKVLMQECWGREPQQRPSFSDVKRRLEGLDAEKDFPQFSTRKGYQRQRSDGLVYDMFPKHVAEALVKGEKVPEDNSDCATVFFSDIVGFTKLSSEMESHQVSEMLDRLFTKFDKLANLYGVYKLETIGDCYIGICNLIENQKDDHVARIAKFCLGVQEAAKDTLVDEDDPSKGSVVIRAGFDSGPVVGNVVGTRNKKYTIFGNTVNTASRMESTGIPGRIQCTKKAAELLVKQDSSFQLEERGTVAVKGRGELPTCFLTGPVPNLQLIMQNASSLQLVQHEAEAQSLDVEEAEA